ncbi:hypothetical protein L6252_00110 [Candidatus Parcubacteria bacterium]|nr:hypothetical protein [Candidatus Parcubacteria bacterium]
MSKLEICDEEIAQEIFGLTKKGNDQERAGWYNQENKKVFAFDGLPKYSQDLNEAIEVGMKMAEKEIALFKLIYFPHSKFWEISFINSMDGRILIETRVDIDDEERIENELPFSICHFSLSFLKR